MIPLNSDLAKEELKKWLPVDIYLGGTEHAVGHLLYARFWHKFLYDIGIVETKEPFVKLINQGMVLGDDNAKMSKSLGDVINRDDIINEYGADTLRVYEMFMMPLEEKKFGKIIKQGMVLGDDNAKMSKSLGNVINHDDIINEYGADTLRVYEMFMGPLEAEKSWSTEGVAGIKRFLDRVFRMFNFEIVDEVKELNSIYHETIKKVTEDIESLTFNTAISQLMIIVNDVYKIKKISFEQARVFLKLLNPFAPHMIEELNKEVLKVREDLIY